MRGLKVGAAIIASQLMQVIKNRRGMKLPALFIARKKRRANNRNPVDAEPRVALPPQMSGHRLAEPDTGPHQNPSEELDLHSWCEQCDALAKVAIKSGGLSHDWCVDLYSSSVDRSLERLPEGWRDFALQAANEVFDYRSPSEREQTIRENAQNGLCLHGIRFDCCPAGCESVPDHCEDHDNDCCA